MSGFATRTTQSYLRGRKVEIELTEYEQKKIAEYAESLVAQEDFRIEYLMIQEDISQRFKEEKSLGAHGTKTCPSVESFLGGLKHGV